MTDATYAIINNRPAPRRRLINLRWRKVGGITFIRLGCFQFSFCRCSKQF